MVSIHIIAAAGVRRIRVGIRRICSAIMRIGGPMSFGQMGIGKSLLG